MMRHLYLAGMAALMLGGCGEKSPDPVGRPLSRVDTSKATSDTGRSVDIHTVETRRIAGTWRGTSDRNGVEATFGSDGTLSIQMMKDGALVDAATGSWKLEDGMMSGETTGATGELRRYASWTGAFSGDRAMNISGAGGAILAVRRR